MKMVDSNPRWRSEDIVDLDLVMPVRKPPAAKDDPNTVDAIAAILAMSIDDEIEQLPQNEIRKNRQKKYLKAGVSHASFFCAYVKVHVTLTTSAFASLFPSQSSSKQKQKRRKDKAKNRPTTASL